MTEEIDPGWLPPIIAIVGPTAVGKSGLALTLASQFPADIVSADSRQVYRYMDIGTAKPPPSERALATHYMLDLVGPDETYSAQLYAAEGRRVLRRIAAQNRIALVVGGTGFYVRALLDGPRFPATSPDPELRAELRSQAETLGARALHARLAEHDPTSAARIHPNNLDRVIRAIEIVETTGRPVPEARVGSPIPALYVGLTMPRSTLKEQADARVLRQVRAGLVEETRQLIEMGYLTDAGPMNGFAYRQMVDYLQGKVPLDRAIVDYQTATHQYIRRQYTWFNADPRIVWLEIGSDVEARAAELARAHLKNSSLT